MTINACLVAHLIYLFYLIKNTGEIQLLLKKKIHLIIRKQLFLYIIHICYVN